MDLKHYIFITTEGYTFKPESDLAEPDVENCQVLGFSSGRNEKEAFANFINENSFYNKLSFDETSCYEIINKSPSASFSLKDYNSH